MTIEYSTGRKPGRVWYRLKDDLARFRVFKNAEASKFLIWSSRVAWFSFNEFNLLTITRSNDVFQYLRYYKSTESFKKYFKKFEFITTDKKSFLTSLSNLS